MSVADFRQLVRELYLEPESPAMETPLQADAGAAARNVAILVDCSGSIEHNDPRLAQLKSALTRFVSLLGAYAARGIRLNVCLIGFSEKITAFFAAEGFTGFASRHGDPLYKAIHDLKAHGGANYQAAFHKAGAWFAEHADARAANSAVFITDGKPTCYCHNAFIHSIESGKSGVHVCNGVEFAYGGKGRTYYDELGRVVGSGSGARRYRASEDGVFEVRVGSSMNWSPVMTVFVPNSPARRVLCALPEYYVLGQIQYFDAAGNRLPKADGAAYRVSAGGNFEQRRKGAWHAPMGTVVATALDDGDIAHPNLTTKVQGGGRLSSGLLEAETALRACRRLVRSTRGLSLHAIGIGNAADTALLNILDTAAQARILIDVGQLAATLAALAHNDFGAVLRGRLAG